MPQNQWISKLSSFDFMVEYHLVHLNTVPDTPTPRGKEGLAIHAPFTRTLALYDDLKKELNSLPEVTHIHDQLLHSDLATPWCLHNGLILFNKCVYGAPSSPTLSQIL